MSGVMITNEQIFGELRGVSAEVSAIGGKLDTLALHNNDHETRIRALERKVWAAAGAASVLGGGIVQGIHAALGG